MITNATVKLLGRSKNEVCLKLYMDMRAYDQLSEYARPLGLSVKDLVRAIIVERFPDLPTENRILGGVAPARLTDNVDDNPDG